MESLRGFLDAVEAFGARLAAVHWGFLAAAVGFSLANLVLRARAWQAILRAAVAGREDIPYRTAFGAYCAGVGVNAIIPARVGDLVKMFLVRRRSRDLGYPTLTGSLVAETLFDMVVAGALLIWALEAGALPGVRLPRTPAFDLSLALAHPWIVVGVLAGIAVLLTIAARRVRRFWQEFGRGLAIVRTPGRYLRSVVTYQALGWGCRVGGALGFLAAFGLPVTVENALLVQVAGSLGSLLPATPGGLGPKQALLVVLLAGTAGRTDVLAFSAGMEITLVVTNVVLGLVCFALMTRSLRFGRSISQARTDRGGPAPEA